MDDAPISPLQSSTIRAALKAILLNALTLVTMLTGKVFDIGQLQDLLDRGVTLAVNAATIYYGVNAIRGRIAATEPIRKKE